MKGIHFKSSQAYLALGSYELEITTCSHLRNRGWPLLRESTRWSESGTGGL